MIAALALAAGLSPQPADVTGLWNAPGDGGSTVRLERCDDGLCGEVTI